MTPSTGHQPAGEKPGSDGNGRPAAARSVTWRALLLALGISVAAALVANYHDGTIAHWELSQHHYVAPLAVAFSFLFMAGINALLRRVRRPWALGPGELAVALMLALIATPISRFFASPWVGTVGYTRSLMDARQARLAPLMRADVFQALPEDALLDAAESRRFDEGIAASPGSMASLSAIPWRVWARPALFWAPLLLTFLSLSVSMGYMLYRQWAERELVPFPLAEFSASLLRHDDGRTFPDIFYNNRFWYGLAIMVVIFTVNGIHAHVPKMIEIPTKFQFYELANQFSFLKNSHEGYSLLRGWMFFAVVAVAVLLPSELSFTAWFTWPIMVCATYFYYIQTGQRFSGNVSPMQMGSCWAMAGIILYAGRVYYIGLLRRALGWRRSAAAGADGGIDRQSVWICRAFLASVLTFVVVLCLYGVPLDLAVVWTLALLVAFLVICRLVAEMGVPWTPLGVFLPLPFSLALLGEKTLGAKAYALLSIFGSVTTPARSNVFLIPPMVANAAHVEVRVSRRLATPAIIVPFLGVVLASSVAVAIWMDYSSEGSANDYPFAGFDAINQAATRIGNTFQDKADAPQALRAGLAANRPFLERWAAIRVDPRFPPMFALGAALVLVTGAARLRFPRFPLHPLPLVLLGSWLMSRYWFSFLLGWLIKKAILKVGGGRLFEKTRPFFVGAVTGLALVYSGWILANVAIYWRHNFTFQSDWLIFFRDMFSN